MEETTLDVLARRLDRLERENRRLKRAGAVMLLGLATVGLMGQVLPGARAVEAERFVVVDPTGKLRADLAVVADSPGLNLLDKDGKVRASLRLGGDGKPGVTFYDEAGKVAWKAP